MSTSRFVVGIDLGTTNSALAYYDTGLGDKAALTHLKIPQVVAPGVVEDRTLLPSFLYLPGPNEQPAGAMKLPWASERDYCVGEFARVFGSQVPTRLVASAKSWLCHSGVDRRAAILPWKAPENGRRVSPLEASVYYLKHFVDAWNYLVAKDVVEHRLETQDIILTVPASFDAVARELTVEAAKAAGLEKITLLEEPQAAFYSWIEASHDKWREQVDVGDVVLVCDVGGGTSDFSLIAVSEEAGQLVLTRVAVGDHILLGGDNMDLALAHHASQAFAAKGIKLDQGQMHALWHSCRLAKETIFVSQAATAPITVLGRGSRVIGGTIKGELLKADVERVLVDGFFPECGRDEKPRMQRSVGLQEIGLPYAADAAVTKHLAQFLARNDEVLTERAGINGDARSQPSRRWCSSTAASSRRIRCANGCSKCSASGSIRNPASANCKGPISIGRCAAARRITAWCGAARGSASAAGRHGRTTSASKRRFMLTLTSYVLLPEDGRSCSWCWRWRFFWRDCRRFS